MAEQIIAACPFCGPTPWGSGPRARKRVSSTASGYHYFVRCAHCHTEGPRSTASQEEAIKRWNQRATTEGKDTPA